MKDPSSRSRRSATGRDRVIAGRLLGAWLFPALAGLSWAPSAAAQPPWSPAVSLVRCASVVGPRVVFPQADPFHASGPGAILWSGAPADCNPADATAGPGVGIAEFEPDHTLGAPRALPVIRPPRLTDLSAATATGDGRLVLAGGIGSPATGAGGLSQGRAGGPFTLAARVAGGSSPIAVTSSYRGDIGVASVDAGGRIELRLEQHGTPAISRPILLTSGSSPITALAVNIDYRGDCIVAWAAKGAIYVRVRAVTGVVLPAQRVAASPPSPRLSVLISDDNRAIVAWESDRTIVHGPTAEPTTSAYLDISLPGVHFGRPRLLERFVDPPGIRPPATGLELVRLAYEGVIVAWTGLMRGHLVVRAAPVSLGSVRPTTTVSDPDADAMLSALATGPRDEVIALWTAAPRVGARPDPTQQRILAARGASEPSGMTKFDGPQVIAGPGPVATPGVAIDPLTDVAVAVWRNRGREPGIEYAVRGTTSATSIAGKPTDRQGGRGDGKGDPTLVAILLAAVGGLGAAAWGLRRRILRNVARRRRWPITSPSITRSDS